MSTGEVIRSHAQKYERYPYDTHVDLIAVRSRGECSEAEFFFGPHTFPIVKHEVVLGFDDGDVIPQPPNVLD